MKEVSKSGLLEERIGRVLGFLARLDIILLILWIVCRSGLPGILRVEGKPATPRIAVLALALMFVLRSAGILYQVQEGLHPDELLYGSMIQQIRQGYMDPTQFWYTTGYFYTLLPLKSWRNG